MRPVEIDPIGDPRWLEFVTNCTSGTVFHHPSWLRLIRDHYRYRLTSCCLLDDDEAILAGLPLAQIDSRLTGRRLVALPFSDRCGPVFAPGAVEAGDQLGAAISAMRERAATSLEVHEAFDALPGGHVVHRFYRHVLALDGDFAAIESKFHKSGAARAINKARRGGLTFERRTDRAGLRTFYKLHMATRRRLGVPTQPRGFIDRFSRLFSDGLGFVGLVSQRGTPAAAAVFLGFERTLTYKYGASAEWALPLRPNNLLFGETIRWAYDSGFREVDFGRTELDNVGLARFKRGWGAEELPLSYTYAPDRPVDEPSRLDRMAKRLIQHSPPVASRIVGELLYKHYG